MQALSGHRGRSQFTKEKYHFPPLRGKDGWGRGQSGQLLSAFFSPHAHIISQIPPSTQKILTLPLRDLPGCWGPFLHLLTSSIFESQAISWSECTVLILQIASYSSLSLKHESSKTDAMPSPPPLGFWTNKGRSLRSICSNFDGLSSIWRDFSV